MTAVAENEVAETASKEDRRHVHVRRVCLVHSSKLLELSEKNPRFAGRGKLVHALIEAYGLLDRLRVVEPVMVDRRGLQAFHSAAYLDFLQSHSHSQAGGDEVGEEEEEYGLGYDCPIFPGLYEYVCAIAGSSLAAADILVKGEVDVAINWYGGWHHGKKDEASGFCYCNDIVLAILRLLVTFNRVLYVDMDLHHGDGVEDAFFHTPRVMTVSLHNFSPGFFPGSGDVHSVGAGRGKFHCVNVPLRDGVRDDQYEEIFKRVLSEIKSRFEPDVVVLQCGADMLSGDPLGSFSLTLRGVGMCATFILQWGIPTLLLGGGGYHFANTARLWAYLTGLAMQLTLTNEIPEHENFECYGPDFQLHFDAGHRPTQNSPKAVEELLQTIAGHLSNVSVQLQ